jgi:hypothetical protein
VLAEQAQGPSPDRGVRGMRAEPPQHPSGSRSQAAESDHRPWALDPDRQPPAEVRDDEVLAPRRLRELVRPAARADDGRLEHERLLVRNREVVVPTHEERRRLTDGTCSFREAPCSLRRRLAPFRGKDGEGRIVERRKLDQRRPRRRIAIEATAVRIGRILRVLTPERIEHDDVPAAGRH